MGKLIAYDPMTMRWLNESTPNRDKNEDSNVFKVGFEDPTYLTFKIEFGGWGASTMDKTTFKELQLFQNKKEYGNMHTFNYDDYPQGLLDLNFAYYTITTQNYYAFNEQNVYNAYNYLLQRNEDVRAEYLKTFIEGLYEIQRKYPYLFKEISGLNSLEQFDPNRGIRLKDANIKLKCIEGIGQKIRAILECYKKAAWDATYQRWVLPENYRQFKMIIYIFERRVFHHTSALKSESNTTPAEPGGSSIVNALLSGISTSSFQAQIAGMANPAMQDALNGLLPVFAYECDLCEFDLNDTGIGDSFSNSWDTTEPMETTLSIRVKNVKTYYTNRLLRHELSELVVMDFIDHLSRIALTDNTEGSSFSGKYNYTNQVGHFNELNRSLLWIDDMGISMRPGFGGGGEETSGSGADMKQAWNNMVDNWKALFKKNTDTEPVATGTNDPLSYIDNVKAYMNADSQQIMDDRWANWWHEASIPDSNMSGGFLKKLWKTITAGTRQIRVSPGYPNAQSSVFNNILDWLIFNNNYEGMYYSYATRNDALDTRTRNTLARTLSNVPNGDYHSTATYDNKLSDAETKSKTENMSKNETIKGIDASTETITGEDMMTPEDDFTKIDGSTAMGVKHNFTGVIDTSIADIPINTKDNINQSVNLPENEENMTNDLEFIDYEYPNNEMESIDFINHASPNIIPNQINYAKYSLTRDNLNKALNKNEGRILVEKGHGEYASLIPVEGGLKDDISDDNGMVVIETTAAKEVLSNGKTMTTGDFNKIDEAFFATEEMITTMLQDSELLKNPEVLKSMDHLGNIDDLIDFAAEFANENEALKNEYAAHVASLLDALQASTLEVIDYVPVMDMIGYEKEEDAAKTFIEVPIEAAEQLETNMQLYSIERPALSGMSMQSMMAIEHNATKALISTKAMTEAVKTEKEG